jgi:hypothetical protein
MNHVPDEVLAAIDDLGEALLRGEPTILDERLRTDLRVHVACDRTALDVGTAAVTFRLEHTMPADRLRGHGSYVGTIVDNVETRLRAWGIDPPEAYTHHATEDGWQAYRGRVRLP